MTQTIVPTAVTPAPSAPSGLLGRVFRRAVLRRLEALRTGRVTVQDHEGTGVYGDRTTSTGLDAGLAAVVDVNDDRFYRSVALGGSLGAAESYIAGHWSSDDLTTLLRILVRNLETVDAMERGTAWLTAPLHRAAHRLRRNTTRGSRRNIHAHYDLGNDLFALFLDPTMTYSCGVFERDDATMEEASTAKLDRICRKLAIGPHDHVLEIGTGWGSFALHAAGRYGCRVTTTTISREQADLARRRVRDAGLEDRVEIRLSDYRALEGTYDKIVSIEMIEAVGHAFLGTFFTQCAQLLADDGAMLIQAITMPDHRYDRYRRSADFIQRYVFPGSCVPSIRAMVNAFGTTGLRLAHLEEITSHYVRTLQAWRDRFHENLDDVRALGYDEAFIRLWDFYLSYCEAGFAERSIGTVQMLITRDGIAGPGPAPFAIEGPRW